MEPIRLLKNEQDYELALQEMEPLFQAKPNTPEGDLLAVLSLLIHEYEQKHHQIEPLSPIEAIKYEMQERGLTQTGLAARIGMSKSAISEIISGKKQMSVNFMRYVHRELGIPANVLLS